MWFFKEENICKYDFCLTLFAVYVHWNTVGYYETGCIWRIVFEQELVDGDGELPEKKKKARRLVSGRSFSVASIKVLQTNLLLFYWLLIAKLAGVGLLAPPPPFISCREVRRQIFSRIWYLYFFLLLKLLLSCTDYLWIVKVIWFVLSVYE